MPHELTRHRHELRRRELVVARVETLGPTMRRVVFHGADLAGFTSLSPDDHLKLLLPDEGGEPVRRDYTPRRYDAATGELAIDFALHGDAVDAGPATRWAMGAAPGDRLAVGGPRGSVVIPADFAWWLLVGDETALPAIGRRVEELPAGAVVHTLVAVPAAADEQRWSTAATVHARWVHRPAAAAADPAALLAALADFQPPAGDGFVWIAAEAGVARAVRGWAEDALRHPPAWTKASGYWIEGQADASEK